MHSKSCAPCLGFKHLHQRMGSLPFHLNLSPLPPGPQAWLDPREFCLLPDVLCTLVQFSPSVMSNSFLYHGVQYSRFPCPSPTPRSCSDSCSSGRCCHPTISSSVIPFSSLQSLPTSGSFPRSQFFASGGQSIGVSASASVLAMNVQDWLSLVLTGWIFLQSKGLSRVFSNTTVQKHQFFDTRLFL